MSSIILKDIDFKENNILLSLEHIKSITVDDIKYNFFKMMITYENTCIEKEILLFEDDIQNLNLVISPINLQTISLMNQIFGLQLFN